MGLIGKATLLAAGYVLGARAGTGRYEQIADAARKLARRPELQPYLGALVGRQALSGSTPDPTDPMPPAGSPGRPAQPTAPVVAPWVDATGSPAPTAPPLTGPSASTQTAPPAVTVTGRSASSRRRSS